MSVKKIKQIITITILVTIGLLIFSTVFFGVKYHKVKGKYNEVEKLDEALNRESITEVEFERLVAYLGSVDTEGTIAYQSLYEDLYVDNDFVYEEIDEESRTCYLTFDDGPTPGVTTEILDILKALDVKATFFVTYDDSEAAKEIYKRIVDEGHTIGIHTASHDYEYIYRSVDDYLRDFDKMSKYVEQITGVKPEIFRFPGGSINEYNKRIHVQLISEMLRRGYTYYDWNVSASDAADDKYDFYDIVNNVLNSSGEIKEKIVLMHDGDRNEHTVYALERIIKGLQKQGYTLAPLNKDVKPVIFSY